MELIYLDSLTEEFVQIVLTFMKKPGLYAYFGVAPSRFCTLPLLHYSYCKSLQTDFIDVFELLI